MAIKQKPEQFKSEDTSAVFRVLLPSEDEIFVYGVELQQVKGQWAIIYGVPLGNGHALRIERIEDEGPDEIKFSTKDGWHPGVYTFKRTNEHYPPRE